MDSSIHISVVSPVYQAGSLVNELVAQIKEALQELTSSYEIILVEDGSRDSSWREIEKACQQQPNVIGVKLSRNFGQHAAITAGLSKAKGEWIVVMDCDLQDEPSEIPRLYATALAQSCDAVLAQRLNRNDRFFKKLFSRLFYGTLSYLTGAKQDPSIANFGIYSKRLVQSILSMKESIRYFPTMVQWVGFRQVKLPVQHNSRSEGQSSYNYRRLFRLALDIMLAYSDKPIRLLVKSGVGIAFLSVAFALTTVARWTQGDIVVLGYTSIIVSIWLSLGLIMATLGMVGLYVGKIYEGVKQRPIYIIQEETKA